MSAQPLTTLSAKSGPGSTNFVQRVGDRRQAARHDRMSSQLAELHNIKALLADAAIVVAAGWIQNGWFAYRDEMGHERLVGSHNLEQLTGHLPTGACLVGAIVQAGGGLAAAHTQPVHRALDLTWHALFRTETYPVDYCPSPAVRVARTRDLTSWNDRPRRKSEEVTKLLRAADRMATAEIQRLQLVRAATEVVG